MNAIIGQVAENMVSEGITPPVFLSGNVDGADKYNAKLVDKYKDKIRFF